MSEYKSKLSVRGIEISMFCPLRDFFVSRVPHCHRWMGMVDRMMDNLADRFSAKVVESLGYEKFTASSHLQRIAIYSFLLPLFDQFASYIIARFPDLYMSIMDRNRRLNWRSVESWAMVEWHGLYEHLLEHELTSESVSEYIQFRETVDDKTWDTIYQKWKWLYFDPEIHD
jgi:hypothetical protein